MTRPAILPFRPSTRLVRSRSSRPYFPWQNHQQTPACTRWESTTPKPSTDVSATPSTPPSPRKIPPKLKELVDLSFPQDEDSTKDSALFTTYGMTSILPDKVPSARVVPANPSYFTRQPHFNESYLALQDLYRRYRHLPMMRPKDVPRVIWRTASEYNGVVGERVSVPLFNKAMSMAKALNSIIIELKPAEVKAALEEFIKNANPEHKARKEPIIDRFGRSIGVGRRKTCTARAYVMEGTGEVFVNGKSLANAFGRIHDRESATWSLRVTARLDKYNVWARTEGGGTTGQAEAMALAIARAMMAHEPGLGTALRKAGCLTRDPRAVERKKPGHRKARKMPAWVKR